MADNDWATVAEITPTTMLGIVGGWSDPLAEMSAPMTPGVFGGWSKPLAEMSASIAPSEVIIEGWKQVAEMITTLSPPIVECLIDADCPEGYVCKNGVCVKKGAPLSLGWLLFGGGAAAAAAIIISRRKKNV